MQTFIIRCPSVTYAQRGQRVMEQAGIPSRLTRADTHGCAYGLKINAPDRSEAIRLLNEEGILFEET